MEKSTPVLFGPRPCSKELFALFVPGWRPELLSAWYTGARPLASLPGEPSVYPALSRSLFANSLVGAFAPYSYLPGAPRPGYETARRTYRALRPASSPPLNLERRCDEPAARTPPLNPPPPPDSSPTNPTPNHSPPQPTTRLPLALTTRKRSHSQHG